jgi:hypothetical protein
MAQQPIEKKTITQKKAACFYIVDKLLTQHKKAMTFSDLQELIDKVVQEANNNDKALAQNSLLQEELKKSEDSDPDRELPRALNNCKKSGQTVLLMAHYTANDPNHNNGIASGHTMAILRLSNAELRFFDPNKPDQELLAGDEKELRKKLKNAGQKLYNNDKLELGWLRVKMYESK